MKHVFTNLRRVPPLVTPLVPPLVKRKWCVKTHAVMVLTQTPPDMMLFDVVWGAMSL